LLKRVRAFAHVDDAERAEAYGRLLRNSRVDYDSLSAKAQHFARMLYYSLWSDGGGYATYDEGLDALGEEPAARSEIAEVVDYAYNATRRVAINLGGRLAHIPLRIHARYQREEILAALDYPQKPNSFREGVWYSVAHNVDAFFVTLTKSEADYSPTTMYADYPISPTLFHWESQSTTSVMSKTGERYISGSSAVLMFVRQQQTDEFGTAPYLFLGPAKHVSHKGDRPIAITWQLEHPMPADFFNSAAASAQ
jgi:hypothetical protein